MSILPYCHTLEVSPKKSPFLEKVTENMPKRERNIISLPRAIDFSVVTSGGGKSLLEDFCLLVLTKLMKKYFLRLMVNMFR